MTHPRMSKVPEWPRPHQYDGSIGLTLEPATVRSHTIVPILSYDEGLGVINSYKSCPQNASFAKYRGGKCYPTSRVNNIFSQFRFSMTKAAIETDKVPIMNFYTAVIHSAFNETGLAEDEVSGLDLNEILELQVETTDRQMFPLYNTVDMDDGKLNALLDLEVGQEGLDTDLEIESVVFGVDAYYDCLQFLTNGNKLRKVCTPLKRHTLTKYKPSLDVYVKQQSNTKYMNPYTFLGLLIYFPKNNDPHQYGKVADTTADVVHMQCDYRYVFNEHNHEFNHSLQ